MENKSEMINRIAELAEENAELKKYIERMDKPEIQVIDAEILTLKEENAKLNAIIDGYQPKIQALKDEIKYLEEEKKEKIQLLEQIINILYPNANDDELFTITFNSEYIDKLKKLQQTLQEIKEIAEKELSYDMVGNEHRHYRNYDIIRHLITKAEV